MPEPLGIDTSISGGGTGVEGIDSPDFEATLPMATFQEFSSGFTQAPSGNPDGFSSAWGNDDDNLSGTRGKVVDYARQFLGMQYKWGGSNPNSSFDCSGFTQYVLGKFGVKLPRVSYQQANYGKRTAIGNLQAGDLVAWDNSSRNSGADHIALYIGGGQIMEFYRTGKPSRIRKVSANEGAWGVHINYGK